MLFLRKQHDALHTRDDDHDDMGGLHRDLASTGTAIGRGEFLRYGLGAGALALFGCGGSLADITGSSTDTGAGGACSKIPEETAGPFPGDGSNGANVLNQTGVVRQDIRSSFAGLTGTATGVPLVIQLTLVSASTCTPLANRAVYLWHCDALGRYSLYTSGVTNQNFLRASNLSRISLASDMVFTDGSALELATMSGSVGAGLVAALTVAI